MKDHPVFSFLMCTFNDDSLLMKAITSLTSQNYQDWELIVLDNSNKTDRIWKTLSLLSKEDSRIRCIRSKENVGWAKGASICLKEAKGRYMSFLAADDFISENALEKIDQIINEQNPDIIWVGMSYINYETEDISLIGSCIPEFKIYENKNRSEAIIELMKNVDYNSFYHYEKIEFLKKNQIDFFDPYYADCSGMTKAMSVANSMVCLNKIIYILAKNTSQTNGYYIWNSYKVTFGSQWESIKAVFLQEKFSQTEGIEFVALRIGTNQSSTLNSLCNGKIRNLYMNNLIKNGAEIFRELKDTLEYMPIIEIMNYYSRADYMKKIAKFFIALGNFIGFDQFCRLEQNWLWKLMNVCMEYNNGLFTTHTGINDDEIDYMIEIIMDEENIGAIGFELLAESLDNKSDEVLLRIYDKLLPVISKCEILKKQIESQFE